MDSVTGSHTFESLLDEYRDKVFRLACSLLGNEASAEDAWIYAIARNTCLTHRRMEGARRTFSLEEARAAEIPSLERATGSDAGLRAQIARLPAKYGSVLVLFYLEDRSYLQVAAALDLPMGTVKTICIAPRRNWLSCCRRQSTPKEEAIPWPALNSKI